MVNKYVLFAVGFVLTFTLITGCAGQKEEASKIDREKAQIHRDRNLDSNIDSMLDE